MARIEKEFQVNLPQWAVEYAEGLPEYFPEVDDRMRLVIELAERNMLENTGGPFAAAVFEKLSGKLISIGVNRVISRNCSSAHAEIVALSLAQKHKGSYDLGSSDMPEHELVVNWLPCAMCYGAVIWSGVKRLVIAGHGPELEDITGFDEGPRPENWKYELTRRGVEVVEDVLRNEALETYRKFRDLNRVVYNARQ